MSQYFINVDVKNLLLTGLSRSEERKIAFLLTIIIWSAMVYFSYRLYQYFSQEVSIVAMLTLASMILAYYIFTAKNLILQLSELFINATPMGKLYIKDLSIIDKAKSEAVPLVKYLTFERLHAYSKVNPSIKHKGHLLVLIHKKRGDLNIWLKKPTNLQYLLNLIYQLHLVDELREGTT